jgi:hypothetical protein
MKFTVLGLHENQLSGTYTAYIQSSLTWKLGSIPVKLLRMKVQGRNVVRPPGLLLPKDIGDLGDNITHLYLSGMGLVGKRVCAVLCAEVY